MFGGVAADLTLLKDIQLLDMLTCFLEYGIHCVTQCIRYQIGTIRRLSRAIYGSTNCAIICGLRTQSMDSMYRAQSMDRDNPWIVLRKLWIPMDCTYVPCANLTACIQRTVNPRIVPGGRQSVCIYSLHKAWAVGLQARHVEKSYHSYMQAFATEY